MKKMILLNVFLSATIFSMQKLVVTNELERSIFVTFNGKNSPSPFDDSYAVSPGISRDLPGTYENPSWISLSIDKHFNYIIKKVIISQQKNLIVKKHTEFGSQEFVSLFQDNNEILCIPLQEAKMNT